MVLLVMEETENGGDIRDLGSIPRFGRSMEKEMAPALVLLLEESHGQRSLGATVHEVTKSDTAERLTLSPLF